MKKALLLTALAAALSVAGFAQAGEKLVVAATRYRTRKSSS